MKVLSSGESAASRFVLTFLVVAALVGCGAPDDAPGPTAKISSDVNITLVVPRFNGGSVPVDPADKKFWFNRGYPASELRLGDTYNPLLSKLRSQSGPSQNVIAASYDWRMPGAPPQAIADGKIQGLLAHWNDPKSAGTFTYAVDYIRHWLIQALAVSPGADSVNVVAHSTGVQRHFP